MGIYFYLLFLVSNSFHSSLAQIWNRTSWCAGFRFGSVRLNFSNWSVVTGFLSVFLLIFRIRNYIVLTTSIDFQGFNNAKKWISEFLTDKSLLIIKSRALPWPQAFPSYDYRCGSWWIYWLWLSKVSRRYTVRFKLK